MWLHLFIYLCLFSLFVRYVFICFFRRASERAVLPILRGLLYIFTSLHLHIFSPSHLHIFRSSHLHIFKSSYLHIFLSSHRLIFTSSLSLSLFLSLSPSLLHSFTSSHIFSVFAHAHKAPCNLFLPTELRLSVKRCWSLAYRSCAVGLSIYLGLPCDPGLNLNIQDSQP